MDSVIGLAQNNHATELPSTSPYCILGKQSSLPAPKVRTRPKATQTLEIIYADLCGLIAVYGRQREVYDLMIIYEHSLMYFVYFIMNKDLAQPVLTCGLRNWRHR